MILSLSSFTLTVRKKCPGYSLKNNFVLGKLVICIWKWGWINNDKVSISRWTVTLTGGFKIIQIWKCRNLENLTEFPRGGIQHTDIVPETSSPINNIHRKHSLLALFLIHRVCRSTTPSVHFFIRNKDLHAILFHSTSLSLLPPISASAAVILFSLIPTCHPVAWLYLPARWQLSNDWQRLFRWYRRSFAERVL